jgi:SAM-dependent methyltransferase
MSNRIAEGMRSLLGSSYLRRVGASLRQNNPRAYGLLNQVRRKLIVGDTGLEAYQRNALGSFARCVPLRGAQIMEIGTDPELRVVRYLIAEGVSRIVGVNPLLDSDGAQALESELKGRIELRGVDATATGCPSGAFDAIFSVATLEHVLDLPSMLDEAFRLLKPGGVFYSHFGPIWSGAKGHHVLAKVGQAEVMHSVPEKNPLPDFSHLLLSPDELGRALQGRVDSVLIAPIVEWVYESTLINRLFYHDYVRIFSASKLRVARIRGEKDPVEPQLGRVLGFRYPHETQFDVTNAEVVLVKDRTLT